MITCTIVTVQDRKETLAQTLRSLERSDFPAYPQIILDKHSHPDRRISMSLTAKDALTFAADSGSDWHLYFEDDLTFNLNIYHNLCQWIRRYGNGLQDKLGTLYSTCTTGPEVLGTDEQLVRRDPSLYGGSQALLLSRSLVLKAVAGWDSCHPLWMPDIRLANMVGEVWAHSPSLVQHSPAPSTWGGATHQSDDFSSDWKVEDHLS